MGMVQSYFILFASLVGVAVFARGYFRAVHCGRGK